MKKPMTILVIAMIFGAALGQEPQPQEPQDPNGRPPEQTTPERQEEEAAPAPPAQPVMPPAPTPTPLTLGEFVMKVAAGIKLQAPSTGFTPESAAWALVLKGIKVRPELASPMTEADAVSVLTGLGYKIRTTTPSRVMTSDRVQLLIETFIPPGRS